MESLPYEIKLAIGLLIEPEDAISLFMTCKGMDAFRDEVLWKAYCAKTYPAMRSRSGYRRAWLVRTNGTLLTGEEILSVCDVIASKILGSENGCCKRLVQFVPTSFSARGVASKMVRELNRNDWERHFYLDRERGSVRLRSPKTMTIRADDLFGSLVAGALNLPTNFTRGGDAYDSPVAFDINEMVTTTGLPRDLQPYLHNLRSLPSAHHLPLRDPTEPTYDITHPVISRLYDERCWPREMTISIDPDARYVFLRPSKESTPLQMGTIVAHKNYDHIRPARKYDGYRRDIGQRLSEYRQKAKKRKPASKPVTLWTLPEGGLIKVFR